MQTFIKLLIALCVGSAAGMASASDIIVDGQSIPGADINSINIDPTSGNIMIITHDGYTVTKGGTTPPPASSVKVLTFTTTKSSMEINETAQLSWTTENAVSCDTIGGTSGWRAHNPAIPNGSKFVTIPTSKVWSFTLRCTGSGGETHQRNVAITVNDPAAPPPPPPPPSNCPTPSLSGSTQTWESFWEGTEFPGPTYDNVDLNIPKYGYHALSFNTGNVVDNGSLATIETTVASGSRLGSISECPGDFNVAEECQKTWGVGGGLMWATDGNPGACQLQPNTTYYFNLTFTDGSDSNFSSCQGSYFGAPCKVKVQHANF